MPNKKISELPAAGSITGIELVEVVQGGINVRTTVQDIVGAGVTREFGRTFSSSILFDKTEIHHAQYTLTGDTTFSVDEDSNDFTDPSTVIMEIVTDGTHTIYFETYNSIGNVGFKYVPASSIQSGEIPPAGTYAVMFVRWSTFSMANWVVPSSEEANLTPLSTPANFSAAADAVNSETEIDLSWDAVTNAVEYDIYRSLTGIIYEFWATASGTTYSDTGLTSNTQYYYQVKAIGDGITYSDSQFASAAAMTEDVGDVTAPVATFTPANAATDIPVNRLMIIDFDESIIDDDNTTVITNVNVLNYLLAKEDNVSGADISITATINSAKNQIVITPATSWGATQAVFIRVFGIADINGNAAAAQEATFTSNDYTEFYTDFTGSNHKLTFGDIMDTVITPADSNFEFEVEIKDYPLTGLQVLFAKDGGSNSTRTIVFYIFDASIRATYHGSATTKRTIEWANVLDGSAVKLNFAYNGALDTNDGLDRMVLEIDDVVQTGKTLLVTSGTLPTTLLLGDIWLSFGINVNNVGVTVSSGFFTGQARNYVMRSALGATTEINVANLKEGTDSSGNARNGTFV